MPPFESCWVGRGSSHNGMRMGTLMYYDFEKGLVVLMS